MGKNGKQEWKGALSVWVETWRRTTCKVKRILGMWAYEALQTCSKRCELGLFGSLAVHWHSDLKPD